jgi:hypothetical protein
MKMKNKIIWVIIGLVLLLLYMNQPKEKGFKKQAGETFQEGFIGNTNVVAYIYSPNIRGQTFTPTTNFTLSQIKLKLRKNNNPTGTLTIGIRDTSGGLPIGTDLASASLPVSDISTSVSIYTFSMSPIQLTAGTRYAIVAYGVTGDSVNAIAVHVNSSNQYPNGDYLSSLTIALSAYDAYFEAITRAICQV